MLLCDRRCRGGGEMGRELDAAAGCGSGRAAALCPLIAAPSSSDSSLDPLGPAPPAGLSTIWRPTRGGMSPSGAVLLPGMILPRLAPALLTARLTQAPMGTVILRPGGAGDGAGGCLGSTRCNGVCRASKGTRQGG